MSGVRTFEELKENFEGVFDFNQVPDCHKMIESLLRTLHDREETAKEATDNQKMLAMMVINGNPEAIEKAKKILNGHKEKKSAAKYILTMFSAVAEAQSMSDQKLLAYVMDAIWGTMDMSSRDSAILGELLSRMKKLVGNKEGFKNANREKQSNACQC